MAMDGYVDDMMCEGLFDNIDDLLDFSTDDDEVLGMGDSSAPPAGGGCGGDGGAVQVAPAAVSAAAASFPSSDGEVCRVSATSDETKICDEVNIHEDWITNFLDDSNFDIDFPAATGIIDAAAALPSNDYVGGNGNSNGNGKDDDSLFQSFSPVSVLDEPNNLSSSNDKEGSSSSSSSSSSSTSSFRTNVTTAGTVSLAMAPVGPTMMLVPARARSKRPRRAAPAPANVAVPIVPPVSEGPPAVPTLLPECESFGESEPCVLPPITKKKKKNHHRKFLAGIGNASGGDDATAVRKCQHCGIQKTPQWRAGPTGPKTLCNACGVRYKSGRLFPEYRPAASPTFVPSVHSNSHKKVVEMRIKACQQKAANGMPSPVYPAAKNCDLLAYIRRE